MKIHVADPQHVHANWHQPMPAGWQSYYLASEVRQRIDEQRATIDSMRKEIARLDAIVSEVHSWIVCAAITTPEDMAGNFDRILEITTPKDDEL